MLLFSTSLNKLEELLCTFKRSTESMGLGIHPNKTKILSNQTKVKKNEVTIENIKIEVAQKSTVHGTLDKKLRSRSKKQQKSKTGLKAAWGAFHKYRQELTSKAYRLCHRLSLFNMVITPTMTYASGTWTLSHNHERMIKTAQRKMLRLSVQTKRRYKTMKKEKREASERGRKRKESDSLCVTDEETGEGSEQCSNCDQDSDVSFHEDADEEIDRCEKEEEWIEFIKRSMKEAEDHMKKMKIPCWFETHRRLKWRMAMRIAPLHKNVRQAELSSGTPDRTTRSKQTDQLEETEKDGKMTSMNS